MHLIAILFGLNSLLLTGPEIVDKAIDYHDPNGLWSTLQSQINLEESRPGGQTRQTQLYIDNKNGHFCVSRNSEGHLIERHIINGECLYLVDGDESYTEEESTSFNLNNDRSFTLRDYYLYLWGLPMKLNDPGTIIHEKVKEVDFNNHQTWKVKVTYSSEVGSDTWYFFFSRATYELKGYQFYHDESINDGEYITLGESEEFATIKIPVERSWYTNEENKFLGTDKLVFMGSPGHSH